VCHALARNSARVAHTSRGVRPLPPLAQSANPSSVPQGSARNMRSGAGAGLRTRPLLPPAASRTPKSVTVTKNGENGDMQNCF